MKDTLSMKKSAEVFILRRALLMKMRRTEISPRCIGILCSFSGRITAAGRSGSTMCLIRKDGIFVLPELKGLNPENLK